MDPLVSRHVGQGAVVEEDVGGHAALRGEAAPELAERLEQGGVHVQGLLARDGLDGAAPAAGALLGLDPRHQPGQEARHRSQHGPATESDGEFCEPETPRNMSRQPSEEPSHMSRQYGSDPNLANLEENDPGPNANRRIPPQTPVSVFSLNFIF